MQLPWGCSFCPPFWEGAEWPLPSLSAISLLPLSGPGQENWPVCAGQGKKPPKAPEIPLTWHKPALLFLTLFMRNIRSGACGWRIRKGGPQREFWPPAKKSPWQWSARLQRPHVSSIQCFGRCQQKAWATHQAMRKSLGLSWWPQQEAPTEHSPDPLCTSGLVVLLPSSLGGCFPYDYTASLWPFRQRKKQIQGNSVIQIAAADPRFQLMIPNLEHSISFCISFSFHKGPINISDAINLILGACEDS